MKNLTLFCGGRGSANLLSAISKIETKNIAQVSIIINGLDDGASTGRIRNLFEYRIHGISDFLKVSHSLGSNKEIISILDERLPVVTNVKELCNLYVNTSKRLQSINTILYNHFSTFFDYLLQQKDYIPNVSDFKIGNIIFAGVLISESFDFLNAIKSYGMIVNVPSFVHILPATETPYHLAATTISSGFFPNEAAVVNARVTDQIKSIFQFSKPLTAEQIRHVCSLDVPKQEAYLSQISATTDTYDRVLSVIVDADVIIYGAGTPYSSILPSLQNVQITRKIIENQNAKKIMIANLKKETANYYNVREQLQSVLNMFLDFHPNASLYDIISHVLINNKNINDDDFIDLDIGSFSTQVNVIRANITDKAAWWRHDGARLLEVIDEVIQQPS